MDERARDGVPGMPGNARPFWTRVDRVVRRYLPVVIAVTGVVLVILVVGVVRNAT